MNKELLTRWVEALRSGEYRQGTGQLQYPDYNEDCIMKYCCLGVLQNIEPSIKVHRSHPEELLDNDSLFEHTGVCIEQRDLAERNDSGTTFPEIADIIEEDYIKKEASEMNEADIELLRKQAEGHPDEDALERIESLETLVDALQDVVDKQAAVIEDLHRSVDSYLRIVEAQDKIIALLKKQQEA